MQIKHKKDGSFEPLYPITLSNNVEMSSGESLEDWKRMTDEDINELTMLIKRSKKPLWEGKDLVTNNSEIKPSKKLSECFTGWVFCWNNADGDQQHRYYHVPKYHLDLYESNGGTKMILSDRGNKTLHKYLNIRDDVAKGIAKNAEGDEAGQELIAIYEY